MLMRMLSSDHPLNSLPVAVAEPLGRLQQRRRMDYFERLHSIEGPFVALVQSGWYRVSRFGASGTPSSVTLRQPGEWIGLEAVLNPDHLVTEVLTLAPGELLLWPEPDFSALVKTNVNLALLVARALVMAHEAAARWQRQTRHGGLGRGLAQFILQLSQQQNGPSQSEVRVILPLHQHELAEIFGVRRETISLKFSELEAYGALERSGRDLLVSQTRLNAYLMAHEPPAGERVTETPTPGSGSTAANASGTDRPS